MPKRKYIILAILILIGALAAGYSFLNPGHTYSPPARDQSENDTSAPGESTPNESDNTADTNLPPAETPPSTTPSAPASGNVDTKILTPPISDAKNRVTKKPFGIKVSPTNSPVQPENFSGYHTGVDFEILPGEENKDVPVYAVCGGTLYYKNYVSGYGGMLIEKCKIDGQDATVLYGHLKFASITKKLNTNIKAGEQIAILGKGYSQETDEERKHLHLGIHKGAAINLKGYVQTQSELSAWLDVMKYLILP